MVTGNGETVMHSNPNPNPNPKLLNINQEEVTLMVGDVFGTYSGSFLAKGITAIQWFWSKDMDADYNHTGIIQGPEGRTFEALWTIREGELFEEYQGCQVIIARYTGCDEGKKQLELDNLKRKHSGQWYPWWRLFMHVVPPLARISVFKRPVCSELVARYLFFLGARHEHWAGTNPDTLVDEWNQWKHFDVIFEGKI
jgi:hypothetical protein